MIAHSIDSSANVSKVKHLRTSQAVCQLNHACINEMTSRNVHVLKQIPFDVCSVYQLASELVLQSFTGYLTAPSNEQQGNPSFTFNAVGLQRGARALWSHACFVCIAAPAILLRPPWPLGPTIEARCYPRFSTLCASMQHNQTRAPSIS